MKGDDTYMKERAEAQEPAQKSAQCIGQCGLVKCSLLRSVLEILRGALH